MKGTMRKIVIVIIGILLNILGKTIADGFQLPIWLDVIGTVIASYFVGIWGGVIAALCNSIVSMFFDVTAITYAIVGVAVAFAIHALIAKKYMDNLLKAVISSFWIGILCTVISTPLNLIFYDGYSGNIWGDTLVDMLRWYDVPDFFAALAGQMVVDIIDKQVCVILAYVIIHIMVRMNKGQKSSPQVASLILAAVTVCSLLAQPCSVKAAEEESIQNNFVDKIYDNTNGMVSSEANVICETDDGYIWIGSYAGLTRYNGKTFEFIREGGLVNVVSMMSDSKGRLWIGTNDAGIARYENGKYTYFTEKEGLASNSIRCFAEDALGNVYVGTSDKICRFSAEDEIEILDLDVTFSKSMVVYNNLLLVMDNKGGLYALDGDRKLTITDATAKGLFYYCMDVTSQGLMVGTESGELFVVDASATGLEIKERINISAKEISAIFEDSKNRIWVATESGFGYIYKENDYQEIYTDSLATSVENFYEDYQGNIWIASTRYGVMKLSESPFGNLFEKAGVEQTVANAVMYYDGDFYCGTDTGLVIIDGKKLKSKTNLLSERTAGERVRSLFVDAKGNLWVCTYNGLFCYDSEGGIRCYDSVSDKVTSNRFRCITQLQDGTIVAGTADGINFIENGEVTKTLTAGEGLANTQILSVVEGSNGEVLAGSDGSGIYVISDGKLIENYTVDDGLSSNVILRIIPYEDGYLVVTSNALCHMDKEGTIKKLANFPYFNNYDVIIKGETAYITCSAGLYEMKLSELCNDSAKDISLYGAGEGLFSGFTANSWNYVSEDDKLYLCGNNGVIVFYKDAGNSAQNMKYGINTVECDGAVIEIADDNTFLIPANTQNISIYASVRNYAFADVGVRFFVKELEENPKIYDWDEIEPISLLKSDFAEYHICLQILDSSGEEVLEEKVYTMSREMHSWEKPVFKTYLVVVSLEILIFAIINIVSMVIFVVRKNELEKLQAELARQVAEQTGELISQRQKMKELFMQTVSALSEAVDAKDRYTSGHSKRVAEYARLIAARMGKTKEEQEEICRAGLLHDVGKIRVPEEIINKAGKLTDEEFNIIKIHPVTGYHILQYISGSDMIAIGAKYHHERYDGKGYPNGLMGKKIPEVARILGVADSYDAMTSNRSYRKGLPQEVVRAEIEKGRGTQFDPDIADVMLQMIDEDKDYTMKQMDSMQRKILSVDDEAMNNKIIAHIMKDEPMYEVFAAGGGKEALDMLEKQSFDLIFLDVKMPGMDGLETLRRIREKYDTPVVLMTSDKTLDTSEGFSSLGCDDYVTKPVFPLLVKEIVHNIVERTKIEN